MKLIESIEQLRLEAAYTDAHPMHDFYIQLPGGVHSSKQITWYPDTDTFTIYHEIDDHYEEDLTEQQLLHDTHIAQAIERRVLFKA